LTFGKIDEGPKQKGDLGVKSDQDTGWDPIL